MTAAYMSPQALDLVLPWTIDREQEEKFKRSLKRVLIVLLVIFLIIPWLPVPDLAYEESESDIVKTKIVLEPVIVEPEPTPVPVAPTPRPAPPAEPKPVQKKTEPKEAKPVTKEPKKRDIAKEQGLTAISSQLNSLRQSLDLTKLKKKNVSTSTGGKIARADSTVLGQDNLSQKSEGIVIDDNLMKNENIALTVHESTKLDGFIDEGAPSADSSNFYSDLKGRRSDESIRRVFEAGKSKAYMYYLRALRDDPGLAGTFLFEVVIEPNGRISDIKMVSSELNAPSLESKILDSVKKLNFGAEDVSPRRLKYKFNFLPS
ncbi:AgmX/PglI C-terminal domain-containing protein [Agarilytica rhodophyticola]|uniref:AgmX/PglI C-terminal domain-containing protein n=1 Tax=Agarilytica rhodophyticola TaxID=1737490 RepID=UPI000B346E96|nr:AgmX/PglI C-terminal domain-containing protein [Agarilytica rhodophyticola]